MQVASLGQPIAALLGKVLGLYNQRGHARMVSLLGYA